MPSWRPTTSCRVAPIPFQPWPQYGASLMASIGSRCPVCFVSDQLPRIFHEDLHHRGGPRSTPQKLVGRDESTQRLRSSWSRLGCVMPRTILTRYQAGSPPEYSERQPAHDVKKVLRTSRKVMSHRTRGSMNSCHFVRSLQELGRQFVSPGEAARRPGAKGRGLGERQPQGHRVPATKGVVVVAFDRRGQFDGFDPGHQLFQQ